MDFLLNRLAVGALTDVTTCQLHGITTVLTLCTERPVLPSGMCHRQTPLPDDAPWQTATIDSLLRFLRDQLWWGRHVLVHCHGGITRSPALCAAYLIGCGYEPGNAFALVEQARPVARGMHPAVICGVVDWWKGQRE